MGDCGDIEICRVLCSRQRTRCGVLSKSELEQSRGEGPGNSRRNKGASMDGAHRGHGGLSSPSSGWFQFKSIQLSCYVSAALATIEITDSPCFSLKHRSNSSLEGLNVLTGLKTVHGFQCPNTQKGQLPGLLVISAKVNLSPHKDTASYRAKAKAHRGQAGAVFSGCVRDGGLAYQTCRTVG